jgi:hypothetical protein
MDEVDASEDWKRYGGALVAAMSEVLAETEPGTHSVLLETADFWLSVGLAIGLERPEAGRLLLELIEEQEGNRVELSADAVAFSEAALS